MNIIARPWKPQDLLDDLQMYIDEEPDNYLNGRRTTMCMARDYLKEHFREDTKMMEWISVKERLPKPYSEVLTHRKTLSGNGGFLVLDHLFLTHGESLMWCNDIDSWKSHVTHWMPLPEPPKEDET